MAILFESIGIPLTELLLALATLHLRDETTDQIRAIL
jgi:hypothetical protein